MDREGVRTFNEAKYNRALRNAEENRLNMISLYESEITDLENLLLTDAEIAELEAFVAQEQDFIDQVEFEEQVKRVVDRGPGDTDPFFLEPDKDFICIEVAAGIIDFPQDGQAFLCTAVSFLFHRGLADLFSLKGLFPCLLLHGSFS